MGVSTELDGDAEAVFLGHLVGLVVDEKGGLRRVGLFHEFGDGQAMTVGTIVTSDDLQTVGEGDEGVAQQVDGGVLQERFAGLHAADVFVITGCHVDAHRCFEQIQFFCHLLLVEGDEAVVYQVATNDNQVGMLGVNHLDELLELGFPGSVAQVYIADGYDLDGFA